MKLNTVFTFLSFALWSTVVTGSSLVTYNLTARVDTVEDTLGVLGGVISTGDILTGILQYDLDLVDEDPGISDGYYLAMPPGDNFIEGTNGASGFFNTVDFFNVAVKDDGFLGDSIEFFATGDTTPSSLAHPSIDYVDLFIFLRDDDGSVFTDDSLPATLDLADYEEAMIVLSSEDDLQNLGYFVNATITNMNRVPEPTALVIITIGLSFLAIRRRK